MAIIEAIERGVEKAFEKPREILGGRSFNQLIAEFVAGEIVPVVHGRWTERHVDYASDCAIDEVQTAKCSVCGLYFTTPYLYSFTDFKFCPNCGADMRGEEQDGEH